MSLAKVGDLLADCGKTADERRDYVKIGVLYSDDNGRLVVKIDSLPIGSKNWQGWANVFPPKDAADSRV